jgi:cold shock CspA family protein
LACSTVLFEKQIGSQKFKGICVKWNSFKGFGFIKPEDGSEDLFCHTSDITDGEALPEQKEVEYEKVYDERKGKERACNVLGGIPAPAPPQRGTSSPVNPCFLFCQQLGIEWKNAPAIISLPRTCRVVFDPSSSTIAFQGVLLLRTRHPRLVSSRAMSRLH